MSAQIDKLAGLFTQIRTLRKRIDSLDMGKVNPTELKSAIDSLHDLEARYAEAQEKKKQRTIEKENREKELASQTVVSSDIQPEAIPVEAAPEIPAPIEAEPVLANPTAIAAPVVTAEAEPAKTEKTADEPAVVEEDTTIENPEFETDMGRALYMKMIDYLLTTDDLQISMLLLPKFRKAIERIKSQADQEALKNIFNSEFGGGVKTPWDYYADAEKPAETELKPEAATEKKADTSKFALDDVVEPIHGTAGSTGRVMRYDADQDMAYVHWDSGKLAQEHGFGAYKGTDLKKRASIEKQAHVVEEDGKWFVYNHDKTKKLSKGYGSKSEADKRLKQIEYFKHEGALHSTAKLPPRKQKELDQMIQNAVYGYQIPMMKLQDVYNAGEAAYLAGKDVEEAVKAVCESLDPYVTIFFET